MLLQIHDELVFEAPDAEIAALAALVREAMTTALDLDVPLKVDLAAGPELARRASLARMREPRPIVTATGAGRPRENRDVVRDGLPLQRSRAWRIKEFNRLSAIRSRRRHNRPITVPVPPATDTCEPRVASDGGIGDVRPTRNPPTQP